MYFQYFLIDIITIYEKYLCYIFMFFDLQASLINIYRKKKYIFYFHIMSIHFYNRAKII